MASTEGSLPTNTNYTLYEVAEYVGKHSLASKEIAKMQCKTMTAVEVGMTALLIGILTARIVLRSVSSDQIDFIYIPIAAGGTVAVASWIAAGVFGHKMYRASHKKMDEQELKTWIEKENAHFDTLTNANKNRGKIGEKETQKIEKARKKAQGLITEKANSTNVAQE